MSSEGFGDEYIDEDEFSEEGGLFTCWSELEGGCYVIHEFLTEASVCFIVGKSQIFEIHEKDIYKHWSAYTHYYNVLLIMENETPEFELTDEETNYFVELEIF